MQNPLLIPNLMHSRLQQFLLQFTMSSLDYLMKKVWHPGSMKNVKIVWDKEQEQRALIRKAQQMKTKLEQQRHHDQMRRLQVKAGLIPASQLERLDFMYEWKGSAEKTAEEYLLGKKISETKPQKEVKHQTKEQITNQICEDFFKTHQDPIFMIKSEEMKAKRSIENNPMKMREIYDAVDYRPTPKIKRERSESKSSSSSSESSSERRKRKEKRRSQKKSKKEKKDKKEKRRKNKSRSRSRSPSSSESKQRSRHKKDKKERSQSPKSSTKSKNFSIGSDSQRSDLMKEQRLQFNKYMKQQYGAIAEEDQHGRVRPNFNKFRSKYKTQHQLTEKQKQESRERMMQAGKKVYEETLNHK